MEKLKSEKKITLSEFWNSREILTIHCNTEEKAKTLLRAFDKLGKKWCNDDSYLGDSEYKRYHQYTCYSNDREYSDCDWYNNHGCTIYEFDEVDLDK